MSRPEPEVIMNFVDGFSYSKARLEEAFKPGGVLDRHPTRPPKDSTALRRDDVDLIVHELEIPRAHAEKALIEHKGDLASTLRTLVSKP